MAVEQGLDARRIQELDKRNVLHSWSVQDQINPLPIPGPRAHSGITTEP